VRRATNFYFRQPLYRKKVARNDQFAHMRRRCCGSAQPEYHVHHAARHIAMAQSFGIPEYEIQAKLEAEVKRQQREQLEPSHQKVWSKLDEVRQRLQEMEEHQQTGSVV
jgi:hypothetical protein